MDRKSIFAALVGHALERYDVVLYGFFASMLAPVFFPKDSSIALISSMGTFAAGYLMRPIGGIFFGFLGDKYGRKKAFLWSIVMVVFPTFIMGILPSYEQIGIYAPIILIICRLFQGFCAGGEFSGAAIFVGEHSSKKHAGLAGSFVCGIGFLGVALGTAIGSITTSPTFPEWGWRIPFLIGSVLTLASYFLRRRMQETPDFIESKQNKNLLKNPLLEVLANWKSSVLCAFAIGACGHIYLYTTTVYINNVYKNALNLPQHVIMKIDTSIVLYWMTVVIIMGYISDKIKVKNLMALSTLSVFFASYPVFIYMNQDLSFERILISQLILITLGAGFFGPATAVFKELFPTEERYSGIAFGITFGQALLGGTTPLIAELLVKFTKNPCSPAYYLMFGSLITFLALIKMMNMEALHNKNIRTRENFTSHIPFCGAIQTQGNNE
jgi:MHS family proline/betaine transporter-like MFS transporter